MPPEAFRKFIEGLDRHPDLQRHVRGLLDRPRSAYVNFRVLVDFYLIIDGLWERFQTPAKSKFQRFASEYTPRPFPDIRREDIGTYVKALEARGLSEGWIQDCLEMVRNYLAYLERHAEQEAGLVSVIRGRGPRETSELLADPQFREAVTDLLVQVQKKGSVTLKARTEYVGHRPFEEALRNSPEVQGHMVFRAGKFEVGDLGDPDVETCLRRASLRPRSERRYLSHYKGFLDFARRRGVARLVRLNEGEAKELIGEYVVYLRRERRNRKGETGLTPGSQKHALSALKLLYRFFHDNGRVDYDLAHWIDGMKPRRTPPRLLNTRIVHHETLLEFLDVVKERNQAHHLLFKLAYSTAARVSELVSDSKIERIQGTSSAIRVRNVDLEHRPPRILLEDSKSGGAQFLYLAEWPDELAQGIRNHIRRNHLVSDDYLFALTKGRADTLCKEYKQLYEATYGKKFLTKAKTEDFSFHCFRHSRLRRLLDLGANVVDVQKFARHARLDTTQQYVLSDETDVEKMIGKIQVGK